MSARKKKPTTKPLKGLPAPDVGEDVITGLTELFNEEYIRQIRIRPLEMHECRCEATRAVLRRYNEIMGWSA